MGWFPDILLGLQLTNPTEMMHILPTKDMPYFLETPNYVENISNHLPIRDFELDKSAERLSILSTNLHLSPSRTCDVI